MKIYVVGVGVGNENLLTQMASDTIAKSEIVLSTSRLSKSVASKREDIKIMTIDEICEFLGTEQKYASAAVIASGDVGFYSIASTIKNKLGDKIDVEFISGISSYQYLTAKLNLSYENIKMVSLHGRENKIVANVCYNHFVFCLTGGKNRVHDIINELVESGLTDVKVTVGENLSLENESIITKKALELSGQIFSELAVMLIENDDFVPHYSRITDKEFLRAKIPMTKQSVRDVSVNTLCISPSDTVYDIGAGSGSVAIAMARCAYKGEVYAIEKNEDAIELIEQNRAKFKAYNVKIISGTAPQVLHELPPPNKVFIGGSGGNMMDILEVLLLKNPQLTVVVNAITLQTLAEATSCFDKLNLNAHITCINASVAQKLGNYDLMTAQNPVYIIKGERQNEM